MARIAGVDLPREKRLEYGLTYIYGIGVKTARDICQATGLSLDTRVKDLTEEQIAQLRNYIEHNLVVEGELKSKVSLNKSLMKLDAIVAFVTEKVFLFVDKAQKIMLEQERDQRKSLAEALKRVNRS